MKFPRISPWFVGSMLALGLAGLSLLFAKTAPTDAGSSGSARGDEPERDGVSRDAPCGPETLPDGDVCVPVPLK